MYFPYVFARQSELLALRAISQKYFATEQVVPVIEPVIKKSNDLLRCLDQLGESDAPAIIILNPELGDFKDGGVKAWGKEIDSAFDKHASLLPALKCGPRTSMKTVESFLTAYSKKQVALLYSNPALTDAEIAKLMRNANVRYHVCLQGKMTAVQRGLLPNTKAVDIVDHFNKQARNADYSGTELFTDRHKTFSKTGIGFGDYTVIGSHFQPGGGKPGAVALHATYRHPKNKNIWVEHFVSDDIDINTGSAASKYLEAVLKLATVAKPRNKEFGVNDALAAYISDHQSGHYPGLGKSKQRQIYHHIAVMHDVLCGKL
jgi:hypothetical protein